MIKTLNIGKEKVTVDDDISFRYIEINFTGKMFVNRLLPIDYLFGKGRSKLLILNVNNSDEIHSDLFYYIGSCNITSANYLDHNGDLQRMIINKQSINTWNSLGKRNKGSIQFKWEGLSSNFEEIEANIRNDIRKTIRLKTINGKSTKVEETFFNEKANKDVNIDILGNLYTKGGVFRLKGEKGYYEGLYHINIKTNRAMSGKEPNESSKILYNVKFKKENGSEETRYGDQIANFRKYKK